MKKTAYLIAFVLIAGLAVPALADHSGDGQCCATMKGCKSEGMGGGAADCESMCPILNKVLKKSRFLLANADEIGLSDDQTAKIKEIQTEAKKNSIRMAADMQIMEMDMEAKMSQEKLDVDGLNAMIDQGMPAMATQAKGAVQQYAALRGVLDDQQMAKAKAIWKKTRN